MSTLELKATKRHVEGKKVQELRRNGVTPAHLFGPGVASESIQVDTPALRNILAEAGHTKLVSLHIGHEKNPHTVMVREVQIDSFKGTLMHVDFYQVSLTENIKVEVPIFLVGESLAAKGKGNSLVQELNTLTVQCLPTNIPSRIEVDITSLDTPEKLVRVRDIPAIKDVTIINDGGVVVSRIAVEKAEVVEEKPKAEAVAEGAAGAEGAAEGAPAEGKKETTEKAAKKE